MIGVQIPAGPFIFLFLIEEVVRKVRHVLVDGLVLVGCKLFLEPLLREVLARPWMAVLDVDVTVRDGAQQVAILVVPELECGEFAVRCDFAALKRLATEHVVQRTLLTRLIDGVHI